MKDCVALSCRFIKGCLLPFPQDNEIKNSWIEKLKLELDCDTDDLKVCSNHFRKEDFEVEENGVKHLNEKAVPSKFLNRRISKPIKADVDSDSEDGYFDANESSMSVPEEGSTSRSRSSRKAKIVAAQKLNVNSKNYSSSSSSSEDEPVFKKKKRNSYGDDDEDYSEYREFHRPVKTVKPYKPRQTFVKRNYAKPMTPIIVQPIRPRAPSVQVQVRICEERSLVNQALEEVRTSGLQLRMECHEDLLSASQMEAQLKANKEFSFALEKIAQLRSQRAIFVTESVEPLTNILEDPQDTSNHSCESDTQSSINHSPVKEIASPEIIEISPTSVNNKVQQVIAISPKNLQVSSPSQNTTITTPTLVAKRPTMGKF